MREKGKGDSRREPSVPRIERFLEPFRKVIREVRGYSPLTDLDGSFTRSRYDRPMVWFKINPARGYGLLLEGEQSSIFERHAQLAERLLGRICHLEILSVPVSFEERYERFRQDELDDDNPLRHDPEWERRRHERVVEMTEFVQAAGDFETRCYLGIELQSDDKSELDMEVFRSLAPSDRCYVKTGRNAVYVDAARNLRVKLESAWGDKVRPVHPVELDLMLLLTNFPGQERLASPRRLKGVIQDKEILLRHFGAVEYRQVTPEVLEFSRYGQKSYASFMPLEVPLAGTFRPDSDGEFAFLTTGMGRRIRISWRFRVWPGNELLELARRAQVRGKNHQLYLAEHDGLTEDLDRPIEVARAFRRYLRDGGIVLVGPVVAVVSGTSLREVQEETQRQVDQLRRIANVVIDERYQMPLYEHCRPGQTYLRRFEQYLMPTAFARAMPLVTSVPATSGPDLLGWTKLREGVPVTGGLDLTALRADLDESPITMLGGPSGGGKTTTLVDQLVALVERTGCVGFLFELLKDDCRRLLGDGSDLPGIELRTYNLAAHPGLLNPAGLAPVRNQRVDMMFDFLRNCCGLQWRDEWLSDLREACKLAVQEADEAGKIKPSLYRVVELLGERGERSRPVRSVGNRNLFHVLDQVAQAPNAEVFFSDAHDQALLDRMFQPGLNHMGQDGFDIPDETVSENRYSPSHRLALAGMEIITQLPRKVSYDRDIRVALVVVEFHRVSKLTSGETEAENIGRVGRSFRIVAAYDTQFWTDAARSLKEHVTTKIAFTVKGRTDYAEAALDEVGLPSAPRAIHELATMAADPEGGTDRNKGTCLVRFPTGETIRMQGLRFYLPRGRTTRSKLQDHATTAHQLTEV